MNETLFARACDVIATGFEGDAPPDGLPHFGGYLLFARNCADVERTRALTDALRARHGQGYAPLIAIDQEGGRVMRLRQGVESMPAMMALGAGGDAGLAQRAGEQIAFDLRRAGCSFDLAPVLDLALDPRNTVIGTRAFGSDPRRAGELGAALARGLENGGVHACYKHFPGHGSTHADSHDVLPRVDAGEVTLRARDLAPFAAVAPGARAIMGSHLLVPAFDPELTATASPRLIGALLRKEFGFQGAFVTDCLEMGATGETGGTVAGAVAAMRGGADFLLISHSVDLAIEAARAIADAVEAGSIPVERLNEAGARVAALRAAAAPPLPLDDVAPHPGVGREIARRAITLVRGVPHVDPTSAILVSFGRGLREAPGERAHAGYAGLAHEAPALQAYPLPKDPSPEETSAMLEALAGAARRPLLLTNRAHVYPAQAAAVQRVLERWSDAVVVSTEEPYDLPLFGRAQTLLASYGCEEAEVGAIADVLFGRLPARGTLPVVLP